MGYFDNLELDNWFKAVAYLGGILAVLSLTVPLQAVSNQAMAAIGFGAFLFGVGRWKNHKTVTKLLPHGTLSWKRRNADPLGLVLELSGVVVLLLGVAYILGISVPSV